MYKHLTEHPTEGVVSMVLFYIARNYPVGPKRTCRLMKIMGRQTIYRRKNLSKSGLKQFIKPYLFKGLQIIHANQAWCSDTILHPNKTCIYVPNRNYRCIVGKLWVGASATHQRPNGVKMFWKMLLPLTENQRLSTLIRALNIPALYGPSRQNLQKYKYPWMEKEGLIINITIGPNGLKYGGVFYSIKREDWAVSRQ